MLSFRHNNLAKKKKSSCKRFHSLIYVRLIGKVWSNKERKQTVIINIQEAGEKQILENMGWEIEHSSFKTKVKWIIH